MLISHRMNCSRPTFLLVAFLTLLIAPTAQGAEIELSPSDAAANDGVGWSVAVSGDAAVVGSTFDDDQGQRSGSAYLFDVPSGAPIAKLTGSDSSAGDLFGFTVGISGETAIVGGPDNDSRGDRAGIAYMFDVATGAQFAKLHANDAAEGDRFGQAVGIDGDTAIVGAPFDDDNHTDAGSAYLFDAVSGVQLAKLTAKDSGMFSQFGRAVAISGNRAIVGAPRDAENGPATGAAYLFDAVTGEQVAKLFPNDGSGGGEFGASVAISGNRAIVGAFRDDDNGTLSGSAYLFNAVTGVQIGKLIPADGGGAERFGWSVGISGNTAIAGAYNDDDDGANSGSAYLFDLSNGAQLAKLTASEAETQDNFGWAVGISGEFAVVGARGGDINGIETGSAYLFTDIPTGIPEPTALALAALSCLVSQAVSRGRSLPRRPSA
jgi:hypothetical protein